MNQLELKSTPPIQFKMRTTTLLLATLAAPVAIFAHPVSNSTTIITTNNNNHSMLDPFVSFADQPIFDPSKLECYWNGREMHNAEDYIIPRIEASCKKSTFEWSGLAGMYSPQDRHSACYQQDRGPFPGTVYIEIEVKDIDKARQLDYPACVEALKLIARSCLYGGLIIATTNDWRWVVDPNAGWCSHKYPGPTETDLHWR
ncbi:hypothetical protein F5Y16DRAFT_416574 [Xylariaceae sp. FL0255]|nr:hypothetical protein F5Y16DRAFT_416574 [Xylariaceae sp. FL0255]